MIKVVNKSKHTPTVYDIYIGRGSVLGNPYSSKELNKTKASFQSVSRDEAINDYRIYLTELIRLNDDKIIKELDNIERLSNDGLVNLVCYCHPKKCHGDVIKQIILNKIIKNYKKK